MSGAIHRFQSVDSLLNVEPKHILLVMLPVTRSLPKVDVVHVRGLDFLVAPFMVLGPKQLL